MGIFVETISRMKDSMFEHMKNAKNGVYDTVKFEVPVEDLVRLHEEAIKFEREKERLREALEFYAESHNYEHYIPVGDYFTSDVLQDSGKTARHVLGLEGNS